ncbi:MAG TPA: hypothetical protein VEY91_00880 [Candidatus Limnocylindria bacterium]|nr:hypothetical protein [Candidatus Limnocylindria bacterium]
MSTPDSNSPATTALRLEGRDALDLLHRISTNALLELAPGTARATLFCDFRGRLLQRAVVAHLSDRTLWLVRDDAPPADLAAHVDRHVFREDVRIGDHSAAWPVAPVPGGLGLVAGAIEQRDGVPISIQVTADFALQLGAGDPRSAHERELERVASGRPAHGHEICDAFHPYEVGLAHEVHLDKGCYTGQEVLLRLLTYGGVRRHLTRVEGSGTTPATPSDLTLDGAAVGRLTTAVSGERGWFGLAVVKDSALARGSELTVINAGAIEAVMPFAATQPLGRPGLTAEPPR